MPNFCFKRNTHKRIALGRLRCSNKLEFGRNTKIHSKDHIKKIEEENIKTWPSKKPNIRVTLMGG
jgi:hypothetical protein